MIKQIQNIKYNREIFTWRYQKHFHLNEKSFMWILKRSNDDPNKYSIWNVAYKEPLYAGKI